MKNNYNKDQPKIYKSENGTWRVRFYDDLITSYKSKNFKTRV